MDSNQLIDTIIKKTKNNQLKWFLAREMPICIVLSPLKITKIFRTKINDIDFYLIEYSYYAYSVDYDERYITFSIKCSCVQDDIETLSIDREDIEPASKMNELMDIIIDKIYNTENQLDEFIDN